MKCYHNHFRCRKIKGIRENVCLDCGKVTKVGFGLANTILGFAHALFALSLASIGINIACESLKKDGVTN